MRKIFLKSFEFFYKKILRRIFFLWNSETIHTFLLTIGSLLGENIFFRNLILFFLGYKNPVLLQKISNIQFASPIGLAAGFDYDAQLTKILSSLGFGFGTVGTITNLPYAGNAYPRLGRLVKSKSLLVNKGFKNNGIDKIVKKLKNQKFATPVGISIGMTNIKNIRTVSDAIKDIIITYKKAEKFNNFSYYELNISCPNLYTKISFYSPKNLSLLLTKIKKLKISKPIFVKMPINESNKDILIMLEIIIKFGITGVIFGNLQKDRLNPAFQKKELAKYPIGNFSGKPTYDRSNELVSLAYKKFNKKLIIIGCGGVFSAENAYEKIKRGANLVQLVTGLVFEGPQLIAQINENLPNFLKKDKFTSLAQAIGSKT